VTTEVEYFVSHLEYSKTMIVKKNTSTHIGNCVYNL
jgi:hypothetical protein